MTKSAEIEVEKRMSCLLLRYRNVSVCLTTKALPGFFVCKVVSSARYAMGSK